MPEPPQAAPRQDDWTVQAVDRIEGLVVTIRNKTTVPLQTIARAVVFGIVVAFAGGAAMILSAIAMVRLLDVITGEGNVWIAHSIVAGLFTGVGLFLWRKRRPVQE